MSKRKKTVGEFDLNIILNLLMLTICYIFARVCVSHGVCK